MYPEHFMPFGTFLASFSQILDKSFKTFAYSVEGCLDLEEIGTKSLNGYFASLARKLGFEGSASLLEIPLMLSASNLDKMYWVTHFFSFHWVHHFVHSMCLHGKIHNTFDLHAWKDFSTGKDPTHPCDNQGLEKVCNFWTDQLGQQRGNIVQMIRVMKVAYHMGKWDDYMVKTRGEEIHRHN